MTRSIVGVIGAGTMGAGIALSPTALAPGLIRPARLVGLHFFNPVPAMKLVEVISGLATAPEIADAAADLATAMRLGVNYPLGPLTWAGNGDPAPSSTPSKT